MQSGDGADEPVDPAMAFTLIILTCFLIFLPGVYYGLSYIYRSERSYEQFGDVEFVVIGSTTETITSDSDEHLESL